MTREERLSSIGKFQESFSLIEGLVSDLPDEALAFVPAVADAWSISDHLVHLLDAESAIYFRLRLAIAEPGSGIQPWDEEAWHASLAYDESDGRACLLAAKALRSSLSLTLRAIVDTDWSAFYLMHPERGRMELESLLALYRDHSAYHVPLIKRNRDAWEKTHRQGL
jgi:uncharacterized damage-inducible protein DinB